MAEDRPAPDELLAETAASFAAAVEAHHWSQAEQLMLLAMWLCDQAKATP